MNGVTSSIKMVERYCLNENCPIDQSKTYRFNRITYGQEYAESLTTEVVIPNVRIPLERNGILHKIRNEPDSIGRGSYRVI